jgi:hypothetical protein
MIGDCAAFKALVGIEIDGCIVMEFGLAMHAEGKGVAAF